MGAQSDEKGGNVIKPWKGIKILDISQGIAGPSCAQMFAVQGAEVVKVEPPSGDWGRFVGVTKGEQSALSMQYNQAKRGLAIDARTPQGRALLIELAPQFDVVIHNFRPGVMKRLGLDYESLVKQVPDLVYVSISGYGPDGPYSALPASDSVVQADSGLMYMNRTPDDQPRRVGMLMADVVTGLYAAQALSAALFHRQSTGEGLHIQTSLFESCLAFQAMGLLEHSMVGAKPVGAVSAPNGVFATADGQLSVVVLNDEQFARFCRAIDREAWLEDPSLASNEARMQSRARLHSEVQTVLCTATTAHWVQTLTTHDVLHAVVRDYDSIKNHPQAAHLGLLQPVTQPLVGELLRVASPIEAFRHEGLAAPLIGEHSVAVLQSLGFEQQRIDQWLADGVVKQARQEKQMKENEGNEGNEENK
jgi:crotonobetainyl-CoA:carnitine CoA-transferase CaiB-like acyl-CoA transferase